MSKKIYFWKDKAVKCTPPQIEGFTWSRHLFNLKGKIRKPLMKNTSIVLMYMTIYIKFCNKKNYNAFLSQIQSKKSKLHRFISQLHSKKCKIVNTRTQSRTLDLGSKANL